MRVAVSVMPLSIRLMPEPIDNRYTPFSVDNKINHCYEQRIGLFEIACILLNLALDSTIPVMYIHDSLLSWRVRKHFGASWLRSVWLREFTARDTPLIVFGPVPKHAPSWSTSRQGYLGNYINPMTLSASCRHPCSKVSATFWGILCVGRRFTPFLLAGLSLETISYRVSVTLALLISSMSTRGCTMNV